MEIDNKITLGVLEGLVAGIAAYEVKEYFGIILENPLVMGRFFWIYLVIIAFVGLLALLLVLVLLFNKGYKLMRWLAITQLIIGILGIIDPGIFFYRAMAIIPNILILSILRNVN